MSEITPKEVYEIQQGDDPEAITRAQNEIGGKIYRIVPSDVPNLEKRIEKLNRKAAKIGADPVEVSVVGTEKIVREVRNLDNGQMETKEYEWDWVLLNGKTPMVPGYTFLATLDHTIQEGDGDPVTIARTPFQSEELAGIDLDHYRRAENRCDHCGYKRRRNHTYVLLKDDTGETMQVGSDCLKDFTGANNPERIAQWVEWLAGLDWDLTSGGSDGVIYKSGRTTVLIDTYLGYVAASIRKSGWSPRWIDGERNYDVATADDAWNLMDDDRRRKVGHVTDEDWEIAKKALTWARSKADEDDLSEFDHNLVVVTSSNYMPRKGDGIVAYVVQGYKRAEQKRIEQENAPDPAPVVEGKITVTGVVLKEEWRENTYNGDARHVMTVLDDRGFKVWGTVPRSIDDVEPGTRVSFEANVTKGDRDETFGFFKRPSNGKILA